MSSYLVVSLADGAPPRRVAAHSFARLFAEEEEQDAPAAALSLRQRLAAAWQNAVTPLTTSSITPPNARARLVRTSRKKTSRLPNKPVGPVSVGGVPLNPAPAPGSGSGAG